MKIHVTIFVLLLFTVITSAQQKETQASAAIRSVLQSQAQAWNRGDIDGFMLGYWNSPSLVFVSGTNVTRGWQPTLDRYRKNYDSKAKMGTLTFSDLEITVLTKNAAVVLGNWSLAREKDNPHGKFTLILRKFKEGWRVVHDHTS